MLCMYIENEGNYVTVVRSWGGGGGGMEVRGEVILPGGWIFSKYGGPFSQGCWYFLAYHSLFMGCKM